MFVMFNRRCGPSNQTEEAWYEALVKSVGADKRCILRFLSDSQEDKLLMRTDGTAEFDDGNRTRWCSQASLHPREGVAIASAVQSPEEANPPNRCQRPLRGVGTTSRPLREVGTTSRFVAGAAPAPKVLHAAARAQPSQQPSELEVGPWLGQPKAKRGLSAYSLFLKAEIAKIKASQPGIEHKAAFKVAAERWTASRASSSPARQAVSCHRGPVLATQALQRISFDRPRRTQGGDDKLANEDCRKVKNETAGEITFRIVPSMLTQAY